MITNLKRAEVNGILCDVVSIDQYAQNKDAYFRKSTVIDCGDVILPIIDSQSAGPGIVVRNNYAFSEVIPPSVEEMEKYSTDRIIDFSDAKSIGEVMAKQEMVRQLENDILTDPDSIFTPKINSDDHPVMAGLKEAVIAKHIDLDKYEPRFGSNYPNDKRLFSKNKISLPMFERLTGGLDIDVEMILRDKQGCANPMDKEVHIFLQGAYDEDEE